MKHKQEFVKSESAIDDLKVEIDDTNEIGNDISDMGKDISDIGNDISDIGHVNDISNDISDIGNMNDIGNDISNDSSTRCLIPSLVEIDIKVNNFRIRTNATFSESNI